MPTIYMVTQPLMGMRRVQHTSTSLVICSFLDSEGTRISITCRVFTFSGSKSNMPLPLQLIECPCPSENSTVLLSTKFANS